MINMASITTLFILLGLRTVHSVPETHSLTYIYTAFTTKPVDLPGIHEFSAVGLLDGRPIDYYDSTTKLKVPKEPWMKENMKTEYWEKGTSSRRTKQQWFKVNLDILTQRLKKNDTVNHVLQWRHGCKVRFNDATNDQDVLEGIDQYSYDGEDFLSFDSDHKQWVAPMNEAVPTKNKWDSIHQLNDYTQGYLSSECVQWLNTFRGFRKAALRRASPPQVYVYAMNYHQYLRLTCMATGFHPKEISMFIKRDGDVVELADGLESTQVRPNGDGTHQKKIWVLIERSDGANYTCEVEHPATANNIVKEWGQEVKLESEGSKMGAIIAGVVGGLIVVIPSAYFIIRKIIRKRSRDITVSGKLEEKAHLKGGSTTSDDDSLRTISSGMPEEKKQLKGGSTSSDDDSLRRISSGMPEEKELLKGGSTSSDDDSLRRISSGMPEEKELLKGGSTGSDGDSGNVSSSTPSSSSSQDPLPSV